MNKGTTSDAWDGENIVEIGMTEFRKNLAQVVRQTSQYGIVHVIYLSGLPVCALLPWSSVKDLLEVEDERGA